MSLVRNQSTQRTDEEIERDMLFDLHLQVCEVSQKSVNSNIRIVHSVFSRHSPALPECLLPQREWSTGYARGDSLTASFNIAVNEIP